MKHQIKSPTQWNYKTLHNCISCKGEINPFDIVKDSLVVDINRKLPTNIPQLPDLMNYRVICQKCQLIFMSPRLKPGSLQTIYDAWYAHGYKQIFRDKEHIEQRKKEFSNYHLNFLKNCHPKPGCLLDIGCGTGLFLKLAQDKGWKCTGVEFNQQSSEFGMQEYNLDIVPSIGNIISENSASFNVITMFDYLEHSPCPKTDIKNCKKLLQNHGLLIIRVPNQAGLQAKVMGKKWLAIISNHLSYFDINSLTYLLNSEGFEIIFEYAGNFRKQKDIMREKWHFLKSKIHQNPNKMTNQETVLPKSHNPSIGKIKKASAYLFGALMEQIDHIGGVMRKGNNLYLIARKTNEN